MSEATFPQSATPIAEIIALFQRRGDSLYGGEAVTQREHALQAAMFAENAGVDAALVAAALLHDVGHLLHDLPDDAPDREIDDRHEARAAHWLRQHFGPEVVEPVRLHVAAKRYLCAADTSYFASLSAPSVQSLKLQGGPMSTAEAQHFRRHEHFAAAVQLRHFDEAAKVVGLTTPPLAHFIQYLEQARRRSTA